MPHTTIGFDLNSRNLFAAINNKHNTHNKNKQKQKKRKTKQQQALASGVPLDR
jgi:hypothetical protein